MRSHASTAILLLLLPALSYAGVYKWVDADGNVHFGDKPPEQQKVESIEIKPAPKADPIYQKQLNKQKAFLEQRQENREEQQALEAREKAMKDEDQRRCNFAKQQLQRHEPHGRMKSKRADGSYYYMNDDEKQAILADLRRKVKMYCK